MKPTIETSVTLSAQAVAKFTSLLSSYLAPEYNALFSGWKKLTEKTYGPSDSGIPIIAVEICGS